MNIARFIVVPTFAIVGICAQAQDVHFGAQATLALPQGDMGKSDYLDGKLGYGLGIHALVPLQGGHALVPRLDYTMYKRSLEGDADLKVNVLAIGGDYNYFISEKPGDGFYVLAGLGYSSMKWEISSGPFSINETKGTYYLAAGGGFQFTPNVGVELRYTHAKYTDLGSSISPSIKEDVTGPAINASVFFRF